MAKRKGRSDGNAGIRGHLPVRSPRGRVPGGASLLAVPPFAAASHAAAVTTSPPFPLQVAMDATGMGIAHYASGTTAATWFADGTVSVTTMKGTAVPTRLSPPDCTLPPPVGIRRLGGALVARGSVNRSGRRGRRPSRARAHGPAVQRPQPCLLHTPGARNRPRGLAGPRSSPGAAPLFRRGRRGGRAASLNTSPAARRRCPSPHLPPVPSTWSTAGTICRSRLGATTGFPFPTTLDAPRCQRPAETRHGNCIAWQRRLPRGTASRRSRVRPGTRTWPALSM